MKLRNLMLMILGLSLGVPAAVLAQEEDPEKQEQLERAMRQVEQAQHELQAALERMRDAETEEANHALQEAMAALRIAQRQLRSDVYRGMLRGEFYSVPGRADAPVVIASFDRPRMGVFLESDRRGSSTDSIGAVIQGVTPGGPADEAGIKAGDIIVEANGQSLGRTSRREDAPGDKLVSVIRELEEGETLSVTYRRGDDTGTADVVVRKLNSYDYAVQWSADSNRVMVAPEPDVRIRMREPGWGFREPLTVYEGMLSWGWLNIEMVELDEELGAYFGTSEGLLVISVPESEEIDLRNGDVILSVDGRVPQSPTHALRIMRSYDPGETMTIHIMRNKRRAELEVTVPERDRGFLWENEFYPDRDGEEEVESHDAREDGKERW
jgi:C-terminal processing protease CtpA/Prc